MIDGWIVRLRKVVVDERDGEGEDGAEVDADLTGEGKKVLEIGRLTPTRSSSLYREWRSSSAVKQRVILFAPG